MSKRDGLQTFLIIWGGQLLSNIGTAMVRFALLIWAFQQTGQATTVALLGFFAFLPLIVISPFAGVVADRFDRRWVMVWSDAGAGLVTVLLLVLFGLGQLAIWHLFLAEVLLGVFASFQSPAYNASVTMLIPKEHLARANSLKSLANNASQIGGPFLGGALLPFIGLNGVMWVDLITFGLAMLTLIIVRIPKPPPAEVDQKESETTALENVTFGMRYIFARPGLLGLAAMFAAANLLAGMTYFGILPAMVLARSGGDELALATVQAVLGIGGVVGAALMTVWGGTKRKVDTVLLGMALSFFLGDMGLGFGRNPLTWAIAAFLAQIFIPPLIAANMAIWQSKIEPALQGRVLAARDTLVLAPFAIGFLIAGPIADGWLEPAMKEGRSLVGVFGRFVGTGSGAGMGLMFIFTGTCGLLVALGSYLFPAIRNVESDLPDFDEVLDARC